MNDVLIKAAMTRSNPFFQQAKQIGKMFQNKGNTNGGSIIANTKAPMSMDAIAAEKEKKKLEQDAKKQEEGGAELSKAQQEWEIQKQHELNKIEIAKMLANSAPPSISVHPRPEEPLTHQALHDWAGRLTKDLKRLTGRKL